MLDKTWHKGQTVAPTCTEQGYTVYICDQDKNLTEKRDYTAALGHDYDNGVVTTPATCTTEGRIDLHLHPRRRNEDREHPRAGPQVG